MTKYTAITFAPVQGFIEKSRKLRDLYGASLILSYLSQQLVKAAAKSTQVISPALASVQKGTPNRILIKGEFSEEQLKQTLSSTWNRLLQECRQWIEAKVPDTYHWEREWTHWGNHTWEIFWGSGDSILDAMKDLETRKLSRNWTAVNWIGESSSITGTDAIAFPGLGAETRNPNNRKWTDEKAEIKTFYHRLACVLENLPPDGKPEGKFFALNEKLSIPELVKRLVTLPEIANRLGMENLVESFSEIYRRPEIKHQQGAGRWTGWFMADGDKVGEHLQSLAKKPNGDEEIHKFSQAMRDWGKDFSKEFPPDIGRVIYAGGDDFLGVIFSDKDKAPITLQDAFQWLITIPQQWQQHKQNIGLSLGLVWAAHSVPQRDILQHCRQAEKVAKNSGRARATIRIVFNSGQYVQWTCPWDYLDILTKYQDREKQKNWSHIYQDFAQLQSRRAFNIEKDTLLNNFPLEFFDIYFPGEGKKLRNPDCAKHIVGFSDEEDTTKATIDWMSDLIKVGWHLCSNT
ncbi:Cas10/Cmr2 second palm domain-containing protein [Nodularia sphaerocarpa]|uniref:Cas10/Cmr2 second palm domain-containing protein n=1 Tax=Nodularia sphaerocarpa TaxID=137816 RepID=UPI002330E009|nr:type III-B CRISPR-associated protein Cas10/Cmr2 [Nodularia sphaerocarpa]MDB9375526.1 type III-B CRISPR-associated protein Cas10/Cmr2 [Nodularia sphaerocarpa CS-585]